MKEIKCDQCQRFMPEDRINHHSASGINECKNSVECILFTESKINSYNKEIMDRLKKAEQKVIVLRKYIQDMVDSDIHIFSIKIEEDMRRILKETE